MRTVTRWRAHSRSILRMVTRTKWHSRRQRGKQPRQLDECGNAPWMMKPFTLLTYRLLSDLVVGFTAAFLFILAGIYILVTIVVENLCTSKKRKNELRNVDL